MLHISACFHILSTIITIVIAISWGAKQAWAIHCMHRTFWTPNILMTIEWSVNVVITSSSIESHSNVTLRWFIERVCVCNMTRPQKPIQCLGFGNAMAIASCLVKLVLFFRSVVVISCHGQWMNYQFTRSQPQQGHICLQFILYSMFGRLAFVFDGCFPALHLCMCSAQSQYDYMDNARWQNVYQTDSLESLFTCANCASNIEYRISTIDRCDKWLGISNDYESLGHLSKEIAFSKVCYEFAESDYGFSTP